MKECTCCGKEVESTRTAYLPKREKQENVCCDCAPTLEQDELERFFKDRITDFCDELNGGTAKKSGVAMSKAIQRQHRHLQGEFFQALIHMFEDYKNAGFDPRNEWAVDYAARCAEAKYPPEKSTS